MIKRMIIMLAAVGVLFGGIFGFKAFVGGEIRKKIASSPVPPETVSTTKAHLPSGVTRS
jgi:membrane fusion protein (multidrug efflux system)